MDKLKKHLEDIKNTIPLMKTVNSIDEAAFKTLTDAIDKALVLCLNDLKKAFEDGMLYEAGEMELDTSCVNSVFESWCRKNNI